LTNKNQTALITGPTSGIGEQFALQMAESGYHLVLVSRSEAKLAALSKKLSHAHGVKTHYILADLSDPEAPDRIFEETSRLEIAVDILVNNAGFDVYAPFVESDWQDTQNLINVNVMAVVRLTHLYLPGMIARNAGHVVNVGSIGSFIPGPNNAVYAATKAFVLSFSEAIAEELRETKVGVTCLCPGAVDTAFADKSNLHSTPLFKYTAMNPQSVAEAGVRAMHQNKRVDVPGLINKVMVSSSRFVPRSLVTRLSKRAMSREE